MYNLCKDSLVFAYSQIAKKVFEFQLTIQQDLHQFGSCRVLPLGTAAKESTSQSRCLAGSLGNCLIPKDGVHFLSLTLKWTGQNNTVIAVIYILKPFIANVSRRVCQQSPGFESLPPMLLYIIRAKMFIISHLCIYVYKGQVLQIVYRFTAE